MRLLIAEDNHELADRLARALAQARYTVDAAHDGEEAEHLLAIADYVRGRHPRPFASPD